MGKRINPATVGAFVLGAIGLILAVVVVFRLGNLFRKTHDFVIYFAGDINGLRVGARSIQGRRDWPGRQNSPAP